MRTSPIVGRNILGFACGQKALLRAGRPQRLQTYNVAIHGRSKPLKLRGRRRRARKLRFQEGDASDHVLVDASVDEQSRLASERPSDLRAYFISGT